MLLKNYYLILFIKDNEFHKKFTGFKKVIPQTKENKDLKETVKNNAGDLFNESYYIYKDRYNEKRWFNYKKQNEI